LFIRTFNDPRGLINMDRRTVTAGEILQYSLLKSGAGLAHDARQSRGCGENFGL